MDSHFFKIYDWTANLGFSLEERFVFSIIHHYTESGPGYFAGYKDLADSVNIPKSRCKQIVEKLKAENKVSVTSQRIDGSAKLVMKSVSAFVTISKNVFYSRAPTRV